MTTAYDVTAGSVLAQYVWNEVKNELGWKTSDYSGMIPVFPVQQQPEVNSMTVPFIVFNSGTNTINRLWLVETANVVFTIYSHKITDINQVTGLIVNRLKRMDESAATVNEFIASLDPVEYAAIKEFEFKTIMITGASGAQPSLQEGGRHDGDVMIQAAYVKND